jgi:hypothetical protein
MGTDRHGKMGIKGDMGERQKKKWGKDVLRGER